MSESRPVDAVDASRPAGPSTPGDGDWPAQAADTIVRVVGQVRDKTTGPAITAARGVVYGLLALLLGTACAVFLAILLVRVLDSYLVGENNTWLAHFIVGALFALPGLVMLRLASRKPRDED
jgi:hypothetical protein